MASHGCAPGTLAPRKDSTAAGGKRRSIWWPVALVAALAAADVAEGLRHLGSVCSTIRWVTLGLVAADLALAVCAAMAGCGKAVARPVLVASVVVGGLAVLASLAIGAVLAVERGATVLVTKALPVNVSLRVDPHGVVDIRSTSHDPRDTFFAQGYASAQLRTFQLEFQRRASSGTLSALVGPAALPQDKLFRTLGVHMHSARTYQKLEARPEFADAVEALQSYADGVNAYFGDADNFRMPLELRLLSLATGEPLPGRLAAWEPADSLSWNAIMAYSLSGNLGKELLRFKLVAQQGLSEARVGELMPSFDTHKFPTITEPEDVCSNQPSGRGGQSCKPSTAARAFLNAARASASSGARAANIEAPVAVASAMGALRARGNLLGMSGASNNWVLSGTQTATGRPMLANDPHLDLTAPSVWLLFRMSSARHAPALLAGAALVGMPGIATGRNDRIAWGVTNTGADVQDLFALDLADAGHYRHNGEQVALHTRDEPIAVAGRAEPEPFKVVEAPHYGPILSSGVIKTILGDPKADLGAHTLALKWTDLSDELVDTTFVAFLRLSRATGWNSFRSALSNYVVPGQNFVFASGDGDIGYQFTGRVPLRVPGHTGLFPVPGNGTFDWTGKYIPFDDLVSVRNPAKGYIVSANNQPQPDCFWLVASCDWDSGDGYRAQRITELVEAQVGHTVESLAMIQQDVSSPFAKDMLLVLHMVCQRASVKASVEGNRACELLLNQWPGPRMAPGSVATTLFNSWSARLLRAAQNETAHPSWNEVIFVRKAFGAALVPGEVGPPCVPGANRSSCAAMAEAALLDAAADPESWMPWGEGGTHQATFASAVFDSSPFSSLFSRAVAHGGDHTTVNVGSYETLDSAFTQREGPSYRHIVSFAGGSQFINGLGQHGSIFSPHYDSMLAAWADGKYVSMDMAAAPGAHADL